MSPSDSRPVPFPRLWIPSGRWFWFPFPALPGLPGSSTDLSLRAVPNHPGRPVGCLLVASPPVTGFIKSGRLATFVSVTRPNRVRLRYGSQVCFPGFHQMDYSIPLRFRYTYERAIYMVNSFQFTRPARLSLVFRMHTDSKQCSYRCVSVCIRGPKSKTSYLPWGPSSDGWR